MKKLRVGIIGTGQVAQVAHIPGYLKRKDEVEIVAVSNRSRDKAEEVAAQYGVPNVYDSYEEMLRECELDAVSVCTPNKFHAAAAIAALQAGCHVFCEKPPALTVEEAAEMAAAARSAGKILTYNLHFRQSAEVRALKKFVDGGELGEVYHAKVQALRRRGIPGWGIFTNKEIQGGGPLIDIGIHMLDSALYLMDFPEPASVYAVTHQRLGNRPGVGLMGSWNPDLFTVEDLAAGMIRFKNGASLVLESSFALNMKERTVMNVHLYGEAGGLTLFPPTIYQEKHGSLIDTVIPFLDEEDKQEKSISHFIDCCLHGNKPLITAEQGIILQKIINGLYRSAETGESVTL
ncbi:Gfo/Idh/MocA family protein [Paenibacillus gansuensis]|uniref:Gfo/Idh/MocA family protein n=1 Tax=Paenibacillus gansuensis TaxID=306542 RepID=A0ABW5PB75_9BACL